jgi:hypothetical protein
VGRKEREVTTEERLQKLELDLAGAKRRSRRLVVGMGLTVAACVVGFAVLGATSPAQPVAAEGVIRARQFILVDEKGNERAELAINETGPGLRVFDQKGKVRAALGVTIQCASLALLDDNGEGRAVLAVAKDRTGLGLFGDNGQVRASLAVPKEGPWLNLFDEKGKLRATLDVPWRGVIGSELRLYDENGKLFWSAP